MSENRSYAVLINPDLAYWVKDREQILLLDEQHQEIHVLHGVEAVVWTWLTLAYPYPKIVQLLAIMLGLPSDETEKHIQCILRDWCSTGILGIEAG